jgi:four helix bundle protein
MQDFHQLKVWQKSHAAALAIYKATSSFPKEEMYGLTSQMRRAAASIPSNIPEGCGRDSQPQLAHFLQIAFGSASELEYQLLLARDLGFLVTSAYDTLNADITEVQAHVSLPAPNRAGLQPLTTAD